MSCPMTVRLGVYALGSADQAERELIESHLPTCRACRVELEYLEPLHRLLTRVPERLIRRDLAPEHGPVVPVHGTASAPAHQKRATGGRWRGVVGAVAAGIMIGGAGVWLAQQFASQPAPAPTPAAVTLSGANPATHVRVTMSLTRTSWGTAIRLQASGLPLNQTCRLIVHSRTGGSQVAGTWDAWSTGPVSIPASAGWFPADISSLEVATATRDLLTVTARQSGGVPAAPASPPADRAHDAP
jgi:anti-sigma factor RsiW